MLFDTLQAEAQLGAILTSELQTLELGNNFYSRASSLLTLSVLTELVPEIHTSCAHKCHWKHITCLSSAVGSIAAPPGGCLGLGEGSLDNGGEGAAAASCSAGALAGPGPGLGFAPEGSATP